MDNIRQYCFAAVLTAALGVCANTAAAENESAAPAAPAAWLDTLKFYGHIEGGIAFNPEVQAGGENFGDLTTDKANQVELNQLMLTLERPIDPKSSGYDFGFKLQGMFGSDSRYTHSYAMMDHLIHNRDQLDIVEATANMHAPILTDGGVDFKLGVFPSPMGAEVIDATGNYLYSHSYIFNFGVPFKNTGALATAHVTPVLDLYGGLDTGVNSWITANGYNNPTVKGQFGFGLNLMDGNLTILGFTHIGAENPPNLPGVPNGALRYLNDITTTWKVNDSLTSVTDMNYIADDGLGNIGYGIAQYGVYTINDSLTFVARGEVWRDNGNNGNYFVAAYPGQFDYVNSERGLPATVITSGAPTTYGEITLGLNIKPGVPKAIDGLLIRPELRVDDSLNGTKPFNSGRDSVSFTPAIDVTLPF